LINLVRVAGVGALNRITLAGLRDAIGALRGRPPLMLPVVGPPGTLAAMSTPDAEPGYRAITGPTWRNEFAARFGLTAALYRPGLEADRLPCPILVQIGDHDAIAPPKAAEDAAWLATGRAEVRTYPIGHFEAFLGEPFERAVADQLHFLTRHLTSAARAASNGAVPGVAATAKPPA
jgi:pimeloyl-ACP methyl ester carboxylesterase